MCIHFEVFTEQIIVEIRTDKPFHYDVRFCSAMQGEIHRHRGHMKPLYFHTSILKNML